MKKITILISFLFSILYAPAQPLLDIYKKGTVKLVPDAEYAQNNPWDKVFETYYDTLYNRPMGHRKSIVLMPNGSVVVNHEYRNYYSLFGPDGKFVKEFGIVVRSGKQLKKTNRIEGVINNHFFTGLDDMGKMVCCDFDGNYVKTLTLDYMTKGIVPLPNNKMAVVGWVIWKDRFRDFVAIVDYQTNKQKIIWEHFTSDRNQYKSYRYSYSFAKGGEMRLATMPYTNATGLSSPPKVAVTRDRLIVALPHNGEILAYDFDGNLKSKGQIGWANNYISVEEQKEIHKKAIEKIKGLKSQVFASWVLQNENELAVETMIKKMEEDTDKIKQPISIPLFSDIIKDSDGNLLFFEIPMKEGANKFNVWIYRDGGQFVCQSSFHCDDYDLSITPSKMVFYKGYIYALQTLKHASGNPLRLVRFKLAN